MAVAGLFEMQDALGPRILGRLPVKPGEAERRRVAQRYTRNLEAYETYQRGLAMQRRRQEDNQLARTAHRMNPDIPETYWVLAFVDVHRHRHEQALRYLDDAPRLNPSFADGYAIKGGIYTSIGRPAEGVQLLYAAIRLAPDSGHTYFMLLGRAYLALGHFEAHRSRGVEFVRPPRDEPYGTVAVFRDAFGTSAANGRSAHSEGHHPSRLIESAKTCR